MASPFLTAPALQSRPTHVRRLVSLRAEDDALWRRVVQLLDEQTGRATLVGAVVYALRLAEKHLAGAAVPPIPLSPPTDPPAPRR